MGCRRFSVLSTLLCVFLCIHSPLGQERPDLQLNPFNYSVSYRQNVCARQVELDNSTLELRHALEGLQISTFLPADNRYFFFNETIRDDNPGMIGVLMDELARRGRFSWRNSFGVFIDALPENQTYEELLDWTVWAYDVSAASWLKTIPRMERGVTFPLGWYDGRIVMIGIVEKGNAELELWSFLDPFSAGVWIMIGVTIVVSGLVYWFLDWFDSDSDSLELGSRPGQSVFLSALTFTGHFEFRPVSRSAQIFTVSLSFWALIMMSAYTANLASYLVVQNTPSVEINSISDAVLNGYRICVVRSTATDTALTKAWPDGKIVRTQTELEMYERVRNGTCEVLLTTVSSWNEYQGDQTVNGDCQLTWIGRNFIDGQGGFAVRSDSGTLCSSLIRDVLNLHMEEMTADGFVKFVWQDYLDRHKTIDCMVDVETEEDDISSQLSLQAMGGTFVIHYIVTAIALIFALGWKCKQKYRPSTQRKWGISGRNVAEGDDNTTVAKSQTNCSPERASIDTGVHMTSLVDRQNEKLSELAEQNMDMLATINAMKSELRKVGGGVMNDKQDGGA